MAVGIDSIPPRLVTLAAESLFQPLTEANRLCIKQHNFPKNVGFLLLSNLTKKNQMTIFQMTIF